VVSAPIEAGERDRITAANPEVAIVEVPDAVVALETLALYNRSRLDGAVLGITGSTGKTTTKDLVASVLSTGLNTVATRGNRNNELGLPLTVLEADVSTEVLVAEMAMRGPGQIADLCRVARPDLGLVTNVGTSHIELLGSEEDIARAKGELMGCLPADGRAFLNIDDAWSPTLAEMSAAPVTWFGLGEGADVRAADPKTAPDGTVSFTLVTPAGDTHVALGVPGRHNLYNAAAAAAVGLHLGLSLSQIVDGLAHATMSPMRMEVIETASGVIVVNDAYNANPTSMRAAVATLADMAPSGRRIAVLGDMAELGGLTELAHFQIGEMVARSGIDLLVAVGPRARRIAEGARAEGMSADRALTVGDAVGATRLLGDLAVGGDAVLVKASRVMGLEAVVEGLVADA
jgi:UDP-N-acetylmuramoyl-tripeptide--D-alanyl-D-alanine ligase